MAVQEIQHPRWGSNFGHQLSAEDVVEYGEDGKGYKIVTVQRLFGGTKQKKKKVGYLKRLATDNDVVKRKFRHRCGLLRIVMAQGRDTPIFVAFLDGHVTSNFVSSEMEFHFAPDDLKDNDGKPIVEVWFEGKGKRRGPLDIYGTSRIVCTFADKEQMDQYLDLTNRRMPKSITHQGVTYDATNSGTYQSSDGNILPYLLVMYFLLSTNEQQAFAAQNPEVQSLLNDTSSQIAAGADGQGAQTAEGASFDKNASGGTSSVDGATYDDDRNQSGGADYSSSSSYDSGSSSSFDSGSSSSFDSGSSSF